MVDRGLKDSQPRRHEPGRLVRQGSFLEAWGRGVSRDVWSFWKNL